jgi:hypothetical protein
VHSRQDTDKTCSSSSKIAESENPKSPQNMGPGRRPRAGDPIFLSSLYMYCLFTESEFRRWGF